MVAKSKAVVEISLDDKDFKRKSGQATAGLESEMKKVGGAIMGVVAALGAVAAAKGAVDMLTTLTKKAIEVADSFDIIEKQLVTLTKSEEKAKAFFAAIKDFAKDTPYQVKDLAQSFNMLYPVFKDKTLPMLKLIGDTAAGTGRSFQDTGSAMMRMATGDWGIEIMRQLFLVKSEFGDVFGANGELVGSQEEAFAKLEEILGDRFGGMMVGMMDTVRGKVSNLKDVLDSLGAAVGVELTPVTKEFLDVLIEVVKEIEEAGELQEVAHDLADALGENKDVLSDIIGLLPTLASSLAEILGTVADLIRLGGDINKGWKELWGPGSQTLIKDTADVLGGIVLALSRITRLYVAIQRGDLSGAKAMVEEWRSATVTPSYRPEMKSGVGIHGRIARELKAGKTLEEVEAGARARGATDEQIRMGYAEYERMTAPPPPKKPPGKPGKKEPAFKPIVGKIELEGLDVLEEGEDPLEAARRRAAALARMESKRQRDAAAAYEEEMLAANKAIGDSLAGSVVAALKGVDVASIFIDRLAAGLEAAVADAMRRALAKAGIQDALSQIPIFGPFLAAFMGMREGGIIPAQGGLTMLPSRPGGWMFPWKDKWINAAEGGQRETLGIFPEGQRGRDLITKELLPYFFPETQTVNRNTFSPNIDVTLRGTDPQSIGVAVRAEQGGTNRSHVQRRAA